MAGYGTYAGGLAGQIVGGTIRIVSCKNEGKIKGSESIGGIAGRIDSNTTIVVRSCSNDEIITGDFLVAGIVGEISGLTANIESCTNSASIISEKYLAGIVGGSTVNSSFNIAKCKNFGDIISTYEGNPDYPYRYWIDSGGIAGKVISGTMVADCYNKGNIIAEGEFTGHLGGIIGHVDEGCQISECVNDGNVSNGGLNGGIVGGAWGEEGERTTIMNCVNRGNLKGTLPGIGGIAGGIYAAVTIENCVVCESAGTIQSVSRYAGGICGVIMYDDPLSNDHYAGQTIIRNNIAGSFFVRVDESDGSGNDHVRRILGGFEDDPYTGLPGYPTGIPVNLLLDNNHALSTMRLTGDNQFTYGWDYNARVSPTNDRPNYQNDFVLDNSQQYPDGRFERDEGATRLNGATIDATQAHCLSDLNNLGIGINLPDIPGIDLRCLECIDSEQCLSRFDAIPPRLPAMAYRNTRDGCVIDSAIIAGMESVLLGVAELNVKSAVVMNTQQLMIDHAVNEPGVTIDQLIALNDTVARNMSAISAIATSNSKSVCCITDAVGCGEIPPGPTGPTAPAEPGDCSFCLESFYALRPNEKVQGVTFTLYTDLGPSGPTLGATMSGSDGRVMFDNLDPNTDYVAIMTEAPEGAYPDPATYFISIDAHCGVTVTKVIKG